MTSRSKVLLTIPKAPADNYNAVKIERNSSQEITIMISVPEPPKVMAEDKNGMKSEFTRNVNSIPCNVRQTRIIPRLSVMPKKRGNYTAANHQLKSSIADYMGYLELKKPGDS